MLKNNNHLSIGSFYIKNEIEIFLPFFLIGVYNEFMKKSYYRSYGFTLLELIVVLSIVSILAASLMMGLRHRDRSAKVEQCKANLLAIANAMESFKSNDGEYIHSGDYKYKDGSTVKTKSLNFGTSDSDSNFMKSADDIDLGKLIEQGDSGIHIFSAFKALPYQCPADDTVRTSTATSYRVMLNPQAFTVYCTCSDKHNLENKFPRYFRARDGEIKLQARSLD